MVSVNWKRIAFWSLLFFLVYTWPTESAEGPVRVSVYPNVAVVNPYKRTTFRFRWQIEPHADNRRYAVSYTCGSEIHSSQGDVDGDKHQKTTERYVDLTVTGDCEFMACVIRMVEEKPKTMCAWGFVRIPKEDR